MLPTSTNANGCMEQDGDRLSKIGGWAAAGGWMESMLLPLSSSCSCGVGVGASCGRTLFQNSELVHKE